MDKEDAREISKVLGSNKLTESECALAELRLRAKCRWEKMTRIAVIMEWGDPRKWK